MRASCTPLWSWCGACRYRFKPLPAAANPLIYNSPQARRQWEAGDGGPLAVSISATVGIMEPPISAYFTSTAGALVRAPTHAHLLQAEMASIARPRHCIATVWGRGRH